MIIETKMENGLSFYKSDLSLKIMNIETGAIYNSVINHPEKIEDYKEIKEFINATPAYAEEAILYKTLLDTVSGEEENN